MRVLLDGETIDYEFRDDETLEAAVRTVQADHCPAERLVMGIRCDGVDVLGDELPAKLGQPASSVDTLDVITSTRHELVIAAMAQAASALQATETACKRVGELLSEGKTTEGIKSLGECLAVWQQIHEAVTKSISMLQLDPEAMTVRDEPLLQILGRPRDALVQIKQALTAQDYVLLADVLQYEFGEVTDQWYSAVAAIRQTAEDFRDEETPSTASRIAP